MVFNACSSFLLSVSSIPVEMPKSFLFPTEKETIVGPLCSTWPHAMNNSHQVYIEWQLTLLLSTFSFAKFANQPFFLWMYIFLRFRCCHSRKQGWCNWKINSFLWCFWGTKRSVLSFEFEIALLSTIFTLTIIIDFYNFSHSNLVLSYITLFSQLVFYFNKSKKSLKRIFQ